MRNKRKRTEKTEIVGLDVPTLFSSYSAFFRLFRTLSSLSWIRFLGPSSYSVCGLLELFKGGEDLSNSHEQASLYFGFIQCDCLHGARRQSKAPNFGDCASPGNNDSSL